MYFPSLEMEAYIYVQPLQKKCRMTYCILYMCRWIRMWVSICVCATCFLFDPHQYFHRGEVQRRVLPVGGEECASNHHVHRLPVTLPYAPAVGLLITSVCDSRTAKVVRTRRLRTRGRGVGGGGWTLPSHVSVRVWERHGKEGNFVVILAWFHCEWESGCLSSHLLLSLFDFSQFMMLLIG